MAVSPGHRTTEGSTAIVFDIGFAKFAQLEKRIGGAESQGLRARWEFGHELLAARDGKGRLPNGYLRDLSERLNVSRRELKYRAQFAERYMTEHELGNAVAQFESWHAIVRDALPKHNVPETPGGTALPEGVFQTIVADPPWQYDNRATRAAAENHYPTMSIEALCELPVSEWAHDEAHLYLWTTNGFIRQAFDVLDAWGFDYKTTLVWAKPQLGIGNYFRSSTEYILFGVRGGLRTIDGNQRNWFEAKRGRHSTKPGRFFELVETCSPGPYLEMFARARRLSEADWDYWGNEA